MLPCCGWGLANFGGTEKNLRQRMASKDDRLAGHLLIIGGGWLDALRASLGFATGNGLVPNFSGSCLE